MTVEGRPSSPDERRGGVGSDDNGEGVWAVKVA